MALSAGTRKTVACLLVGLGAMLVVIALLVPTYTKGKLAKTPLDLEITTVAKNVEGEDSMVLDSSSLTSEEGSAQVDTDVPMIFQRFVTVEDPSDADEMTIQAGSALRRTDSGQNTGLLDASIDVVTIDRKTGEPVDRNPNGSIAVTVDAEDKSVAEPNQREGLQYRFPIDTEKKTYPYYDRSVRKTYDINFVEETEINSTKIYHFQQTIPATNMWETVKSPSYKLELPAEKWGVEGGEEPVTMYRWYSNVRDVWVEPQTGTVVKGGEQLHMFYSRDGKTPEVTALKTHLVFDENTIESQLEIAKENTDKLALFSRTLPIVLGIIGVIAVIAGVVLGLFGGGSAGTGGAGPRTPRGSAPAAKAAPSRGEVDSPTVRLPKS